MIIDDDEDDFFILSEYIKKIPGYQFQVDWIFLYNEALQSLCDAKYDLYFVDYRLGIQTGLDLLKEAMSKNCEEPVILLSGKGNQQIDREAMEAGAIDYLVKSELNGEKLERCIRYSIERSRSMKALKQNEKKLRNIFEKSKDIVFLADEKLNFQDVNKAALDLLGYSHDQLLTLNLRELLYRDDPGFSITGILSDHGEIDDHILELKTITGEKIICLLSASREKVQNGSPYVQGILHDITNLKKMERANLQAEKLNTANRLLKILAHEVRGPLTNINLSVEELQAESLGPQSRVYMDIIYRNSNRINDLITELLQSSRHTEMNREPINLEEILRDALSRARDRITLKKIKTVVFFPGPPAIVDGDPEKLKIAFLNLIINATEAIAHDHGQLELKVEENQAGYLVHIGDNGSGISEENRERLFEPYFTSKRNGLGLGLPAALSILQSHRATIDVKTILYAGTTFLISFSKAQTGSGKNS